jgi:hypothetical protein
LGYSFKSRTLPFPAYILLSLSIPPPPPRFFRLIVSGWPTFQIPKYKKVRFTVTRNKCQLCDDTEPNSVFIAYLDVRSDKSDTNWLLLDYEAWALFYFSPKGSLHEVLTWLCGDPRTIALINWFSPRRVLAV